MGDLEQRREHFKKEGIEEGEFYAFYFKKRKRKKKKASVTKNTAHEPILHQAGEEKRATEDSGRGGAPVFERTLSMNFSKIIFIWRQVTFKNLLSGTPDMEIQ